MSESSIYDYEFFTKSDQSTKNEGSLSIINFDAVDLSEIVSRQVNLKSTLFLLVLSGSGMVEINDEKYPIGKHHIMLLSFGHVFKIDALSADFTCISLYIEKDYVAEMFSIDMLYKRVKYNVKMYKNPLLHLSTLDFKILFNRIQLIKQISLQTNHIYYREMLLNALRIYFLDLSNYIESQQADVLDDAPTREEVYFQQFLTLILKHYKSEHLVQFYADKIAISAHYLTQIVKKLTGQTVSDFVFDLLYSEARQLLKQPDISIQQIADQLSFSDQSAFGKFFKRKAGISPSAFRKM